MIHSTAIIHPDAAVHASVNVDAYAIIENNVTIDENSWIGPHSIIHSGARIGKNVKIYKGACISCIPQDLKFEGEVTEAFIGNGTWIREFVTVSRGTKDRYKTVVGVNCLLMAYSHIGHDCIIGNNCILANSVQLAGHVIMENNIRIGGLTGIHQFSKLGEHCIVGAGVLVTQDIPPFVMVGKNPLQYCGINKVGLQRSNFSSEKIREIHDMYDFIYNKGFNRSEGMQYIKENFPNSLEKQSIIHFIETSERGIIRGQR